MVRNNSPQYLSDIIGQEKIKESLRILVDAAKHRHEALDHLLFCAPPGYGKTVLANVVANEMGIESKFLIGSAVERAGDFAKILTDLRAGHILIIKEIETLRKTIIELLNTAMEDFFIDIVIGKGLSARSLQLKLPRFTVIGITSKPSQVNERLKKLMFQYVLAPYDELELGTIILSFANQQDIVIHPEAANLLAKHCNGSPDEARRLLRSVHKYSIARSNGELTTAIVEAALPVMLNQQSVPIAAEREPIPDNVKIFVWQRDKGRCVMCGSQEKLEFDHIIPLALGGSNTERNIQLLCEKHNRNKGARIG